MASLSNQIKAFLISKGKTETEVELLFRNLSNTGDAVILISDGKTVNINKWTVDGISQPSISDLSAFDADATNLETVAVIYKNRIKNYPSLEEQMDMQYWDSVNGTTTWKDAIAKVKSDYPKPS